MNDNQKSSESGLAASLLTAVIKSGPDDLGLKGLSPPPDKWWQSLDGSHTIEVAPEPEESIEMEPVTIQEPEDKKHMDIDTAPEDEDNEFEVRA